jgi:hypothetical protein
MAKRQSPDRVLNDLAIVRRDPASPAAREALVNGLASSSSVVVEKAAALVEELKVSGFSRELVAAFDRMMRGTDRGCAAKSAVAKALVGTDVGPEAEGAFLAGVRHHQFDGPPVNGRATDTAGPLRGYCGLGLLNVRYRDALVELTDLLADPEPAARIGAARGLASTGREEAALLLRLRVLSGEKSPEVLSECVTAMLRVDPKRSLPLAERLLGHEAWDVRDAVAFALGDWGHPSALPLLRAAFEREEEPDVRRSILVGAGLIRAHEAVDWLVSVIGSAPPRDAAAAVDSLRVSHGRDGTVAARARSAVEARPLEPLKRALAQWQ